MKKHLILLSLMALLACSRLRPATEPFPHYQIDEEDWITYEGVLPLQDGADVFVELSLMPGAPGMESHYRMIESIHSKDPVRPFACSISSAGRYAVLATAGASMIQITAKRRTGARFCEEGILKEHSLTDDLYLMSNGEHQLLPVDGDFQPIGQYKLTRRASPLFTVEGYFTVHGDTSDFFEKNTRKQWAVAQLGEYDQAVKKYNYLAKEKFEGVYVKALSYSVLQRAGNGDDVKALVFKKIIEIDSLPALTMN